MDACDCGETVQEGGDHPQRAGWPPDLDAIPDKRAFEEAVAASLASLLARMDADKGKYTIELVGAFPDTKLKVAGRGLASGRPMEWEFSVWEFWADDGTAATVEGTAVLIWANMDE